MSQILVYFSIFAETILADPPHFFHDVYLHTARPLNIAHRGASGELPEHSVASYQRAVDQGADVIECDICVTKDLQLVCLHQSWLSSTTNAADVFSEDQKSTYFVGASFITDWFTVDFTLEELLYLRLKQSRGHRDPNYNGMYRISTIQQYIQVAKNSVNRPIGLYPETKDPRWVNSLDIILNANTTLEDLLMEALHENGYTLPRDPVFIQSFYEDSLRYMHERTELPLVQLLGNPVLSDSRWEELATYCYGVGLTKPLIVSVINGQITGHSEQVTKAHEHGLRVHAWTFRNEDRDLAWDYGQDYWNELEEFFSLNIDGYFTDFPKGLHRFLEYTYRFD